MNTADGLVIEFNYSNGVNAWKNEVAPDRSDNTLKHGGVILFQGHETTCGIFAKRKVTVADTSLQA